MRFIPDAKSAGLRCHSKIVFYLFCLFWGLRKTGSSRKRAYWFIYRGLRYFHTFALVVDEHFMRNLSAFLLFFGDIIK